MQHQHAEAAVVRTIPIPVTCFNHIKDTQRALEASTGHRPSLNETLGHVIREHKRLHAINETRSHAQANQS